MLVLSQLEADITLKQWQSGQINMDTLRNSQSWQEALSKAKKYLSKTDLSLETDISVDMFSQWNGFDLAIDFYRLRNADQLALRDISASRIAQYTLLTQLLATDSNISKSDADNTINMNSTLTSVFKRRFGNLFSLFDGFKNGEPSDHFMLNLSDGTITDLKK
jgi:hypothetical protein